MHEIRAHSIFLHLLTETQIVEMERLILEKYVTQVKHVRTEQTVQIIQTYVRVDLLNVIRVLQILVILRVSLLVVETDT